MNTQQLIVNPLDCLDQIREHINNTDRRGEYSGFESLDRIYSAKKGYPLFVAGAPHSGKSQLVLQMMVNWAQDLGWKGLIYMGEEGSIADIVWELIWIKEGKDPSNMKEELIDHVKWVAKHFDLVDPIAANEKRFGIEEWMQLTDVEDKYDFTLLDPWNDLDFDAEVRDDIYLTRALKQIRKQARKYDRVDIVTNHIAKTSHDGKTKGGMPVSKPARPNEWAGGQTWFRRAFTMLLVYRPPEGDLIDFLPHDLQSESDMDEDDPGYKVGPGEVWIQNQKAKPKGTGQLGWARLYFDKEKHQYFECDEREGRYTLEDAKIKRYYSGELKHASSGERTLDNFRQQEPAPLTANHAFLNSTL